MYVCIYICTYFHMAHYIILAFPSTSQSWLVLCQSYTYAQDIVALLKKEVIKTLGYEVPAEKLPNLRNRNLCWKGNSKLSQNLPHMGIKHQHMSGLWHCFTNICDLSVQDWELEHHGIRVCPKPTRWEGFVPKWGIVYRTIWCPLVISWTNE